MSTSSVVLTEARVQPWARARDYLMLTKPKIAVLELVTVLVAALSARGGISGASALESSIGSLSNLGSLCRLESLWHALVGTALVAASASAMNQWLEVSADRRMERTRTRPLPAGRLSPWEVALFGVVTLSLGLTWLAWRVNLWTAALGLASWALYVLIYTPLKSRSSWNTWFGAVAGALPVAMGWSSTGAPLGWGAVALFAIVFAWQFPHFMAIAWMYREEYARAGFRMASVVDPSGCSAGRQAVLGAIALLPIGLIPWFAGLAGTGYAIGSLAWGAAYVVYAFHFRQSLTDTTARALLRASLVYLPGMLLTRLLAP